jgi:hypothetical protein
MVVLKKHLLATALLTFVFGVGAMNADAAQATFNLPFDAYWGGAHLSPGEYKFWTASGFSSRQVLQVHGNGKTQYVLIGIESVGPISDKSYLEIAPVNGVQVVREFRSGAEGKVFSFQGPKTNRWHMANRATEATKIAVMVH